MATAKFSLHQILKFYIDSRDMGGRAQRKGFVCQSIDFIAQPAALSKSNLYILDYIPIHPNLKASNVSTFGFFSIKTMCDQNAIQMISSEFHQVQPNSCQTLCFCVPTEIRQVGPTTPVQAR